MRIITCTGYFSTGSSAICDLLSEYKGFYLKNDYELRFIYDPDGLSDLEYHLVENHNRHNSGHAIKRYKRLVDFYCGNSIAKKNEWYFNGKWKTLSTEYLSSLTEFSYKGAWLYDYLDRGVFFHYFNSLLRKLINKDMLYNEITPCSYPSKEVFFQKTKNYLSKLFDAACDRECDVFLVDQALPPSDIQRYIPMFNDVYVFIVDRDPRDVYFLEKYIRKETVIPTCVQDFCKWFEYTRRHRKYEKINTDYSHFIQFEDMIYRYEETKKCIETVLGMCSEYHKSPKTRFIPEKSINNTQIWRRIDTTPEQVKELQFIENTLSEYLYEFPPITINKNKERIE